MSATGVENMAKNNRNLGYSMARHRLRQIDGRSRLGRLWRDVQHQLTDALGGDPAPGEQILIAEIADMTVRCTILSERLLTGDVRETAAEAERRYAWWSERTRRMLQALGLERRVAATPRLADFLKGAA